jgi:hypothetical protein
MVGELNRRSFLRGVGAAGLLSIAPEAGAAVGPAGEHIVHEVVQATAEEKPKYSIKFSVLWSSVRRLRRSRE